MESRLAPVAPAMTTPGHARWRRDPLRGIIEADGEASTDGSGEWSRSGHARRILTALHPGDHRVGPRRERGSVATS
jgi:hypothetical protein